MNILIPMAGEGQRFVEAGYKDSKPSILTYDRWSGELLPMVVCATLDLSSVEKDGQNIIFIERNFHKENGTENKIKDYFSKAKFISVDHLTQGQACTCLLAENFIDNDDELLIAGCDNGMEYDKKAFENAKNETDVLVFTYRNNEAVLDNPNAYGWMKTDENSTLITDISIKKALSDNPLLDHAVVATFWFKKGRYFVEATKEMIKENDRVNGEFYVDQVIKYILKKGLIAKVFEIDRYICWGTPKDYENYQKTFKYWHDFYKAEKRFFKNNENKKCAYPFMIGIAGDSGSGKSTLLPKIDDILGANNEILYIEGDGYHKWERHNQNWTHLTALNPKANFLHKQIADIKKLKLGDEISRVDYDHGTGKFTDLRTLEAKKYVVLSGLHSLYSPQLRNELDLKIFMNPDETLRKYWKIKRDKEERGYTKEKVLNSLEQRKDDSNRYIRPQKAYADIIISYFDDNLSKNLINDDYKVELKVKISIELSYNIDAILDNLKTFGLDISQEINDNKQDIIFRNNKMIYGQNIEELANKIMPGYNNFLVCNSNWADGLDGIVEIFILYMIYEKLKGNFDD